MISVLGMAGGPLLGLFIMGMFLPCVNAKVNKSINLCFAYKGWGMLFYGLIHVVCSISSYIKLLDRM